MSAPVHPAGLDPPIPEPTLGEKVAFLSALPGVTEVIETHMAFVFLTADLALKLKKPVLVGHSDCRTLAARERAVAKEICLNRSLAPGVYLRRLSLCRTPQGLALGGGRGVVDWLVQMRRLPRDAMLDTLIRQGRRPDPARMDALIRTLMAFFRRQSDKGAPRHLFALHLAREMAVNQAHLAELSARLPHPESLFVVGHLARRLKQLRPEIMARDRNGLVIEGHGDLKPEHVCLLDPPVIFDRAEAALELRVIDIWDEAMFLAAECAMLGHTGLGGKLADALLAAGFTPPSTPLLIAFIQFRLVTRARLALDHLRDARPCGRQDWPGKAQRYLDAAAALCATGDAPARNRTRPAMARVASDAAAWGAPRAATPGAPLHGMSDRPPAA